MDDFFFLEPSTQFGRVWMYDKERPKLKKVETLPYFFVMDKRGKYRYIYDSNYRGSKKEFSDSETMETYMEKSKMKLYETDVQYFRRVMIDEDLRIGHVPKLYVDIETDDSNGFSDWRRDKILCIGAVDENGKEFYWDGDEAEILQGFMKTCKTVGAVITYNGGQDVWDSRAFDIPYLAGRWGAVINEDDPIKNSALRHNFDERMQHCKFFDIYQIYRYEMARIGKSISGGMGLDNVAKQELGHGKVSREKRICDMTDAELHEYNMRDVYVLRELDEKFHFTDLKIGLARASNSLLTFWHNNKRRDGLGPLNLVDNLLLKHAHELGLILPNSRYTKDRPEIVGAYVKEPVVGLHVNVQNVDVMQMYPNIMINEKVSPDPKRCLIPNILRDLMTKRRELKARYKESKSTEDYIQQYNYKVLANVFYGAYANPYCRLFSEKFANYITSKGQKILKQIIELSDAMGYKVLYGDTDSIFVSIDKEKVDPFVSIINTRIEPYKIEAGEFYTRMLFTGTREGGLKKKYAGIEDTGELLVKGLEAVKRNYCMLSRNFQKTVLNMLLSGKTVSEVEVYVDQTRQKLISGEYDKDLVITMGVKNLEEYSAIKNKDKKPPPHVIALKKAYKLGAKSLFDINFVYGKDGPEPILKDSDLDSIQIDYSYYYQKQMLAVVRPLLDSVRIGDGTYVEPSKKTRRADSTYTSSLMSFVST